MNNDSYLLMTDQEYVPFGVELQVSNLEQSLKFYRDVLGFSLIRVDAPAHDGYVLKFAVKS